MAKKTNIWQIATFVLIGVLVLGGIILVGGKMLNIIYFGKIGFKTANAFCQSIGFDKFDGFLNNVSPSIIGNDTCIEIVCGNNKGSYNYEQSGLTNFKRINLCYDGIS